MEAALEIPRLAPEFQAINDAPVDEPTRRTRFHAAMDGHKGVEFIHGKIIKQPPLEWRHLDAVGKLGTLLSFYVHRQSLGEVFSAGMLVSLTRNDYEPDLLFFRPEKAAKFAPEQITFPAPDFVTEVLSPSTEQRDRGIKKQDYAAHGVREYWIVDPALQAIEQYQLHGAEYRLLGTWKAGDSIVSFVVPGFCIPVFSVFDTDANVAALLALTR